MTDLQKAILSIYKEIAEICTRNTIPFYAIGGTCIGAIRHKGFIPWDDDIDIGIPIEYYEYFIDVARKELPSYLFVYSAENIRHYAHMFVKICDSRTTFIEKNQIRYIDAYKGVFVDVMPISGVPETPKERNFYYKKLRRLNSLNYLLRFSDYATNASQFIRKLPFRLINIFIPYNYFFKKYHAQLNKYPLSSSKIAGYVWLPKEQNLVFPSEWFGDPIMMTFEDTFMYCPNNYDACLKTQFGDYMTPPSPDNQKKHLGLIDLNTPFYIFH